MPQFTGIAKFSTHRSRIGISNCVSRTTDTRQHATKPRMEVYFPFLEAYRAIRGRVAN